MADVTKQSWYLPNGSYADNVKAFKEYLVSLGKKYSELTDVEKAAIQDFKEDLELMEYQKTKVKADFYEAKDAAFETVRTKHANEIKDLNDTWQAAEDNDFTIPQ